MKGKMMLHLILGTADCGKSKLAEQMVCENAKEMNKYYIATMIPYGTEGEKRVEKHRKLREGKGFITIECSFDVDEAVTHMSQPERSFVLLECVTNLVANELFERKTSSDKICELVQRQIRELCSNVKELYVVSNYYNCENSSDDGPEYDAETLEYIRILHEVNEMIKGFAEEVVEIKK